MSALRACRFGDRWELVRDIDGVGRRIGILHSKDDADRFVASEDLLEVTGRAADRIDSLLAALTLPLPQEIHLAGLRAALPEIRNDLNAAYIRAGGEA
ncbi:MAG TPA: hypothetical protein DCQ64_09505 [Candidatus Rokubacteria bacterium]|nr:hypothetical protein [Candidatus Rokubacteria bacterium]